MLRSLCQQLVAAHKLRGRLPDADGDLLLLYHDLLRLTPSGGTQIVVVLDGFDEAQGWHPPVHRDQLFPALPWGKQVVFSARAEYERDWPAEFDLALSQDEQLRLRTLGRREVRRLFEQELAGQADWALTQEAVALVTRSLKANRSTCVCSSRTS